MTDSFTSQGLRNVGADFRWIGQHGIGRFAAEVLGRLSLTPVKGLTPLFHPLDPICQSLAVRSSKCRLYFSPGFNPPVSPKVPCVFVIHDLMHINFPSERTAAKSLYYQHVVLPAAMRAPKVLTVSEFSKREILAWSRLDSDRIEVVHNGVSSEFVPAGQRSEFGFPYLLYVGNYKPHKNIPRMLTAFKVSGISDHIKLCLSGPGTAELANHAQQLGIGSRIQFLGSKTNDELAQIYRGALGVLSPSLHEGFGLPALEAMACGTPALVAKGHGAEEVTSDAAIVCDPLSVESISEGIEHLVTNHELRHVLIKRGLDRVRFFSWDSIASRVAGILQSV